MLHSGYSKLPFEPGSPNQTSDNLPYFSFAGENSFILQSPHKSGDHLNQVNRDVASRINDILDSALTIKENINDFKVDEHLGELVITSNLPEMDGIADGFALIENADEMDSLLSTFAAIDDSILVTHEDNLPVDEAAFKMNYSFPDDFANVQIAASTFDEICSKKLTFNEAEFDVSYILESAVRPNLKCFRTLDETDLRNADYDHSAGFKDYDKLAMKKRKPDFLFHSLIDKVILKNNTSTFECLTATDLDVKMLIEEYKEYLSLADNSPYEPNWDLEFVDNSNDDGWNMNELKRGIALRYAFNPLSKFLTSEYP